MAKDASLALFCPTLHERRFLPLIGDRPAAHHPRSAPNWTDPAPNREDPKRLHSHSRANASLPIDS
jgi:hypothetical protein